jgi:hypothetical protein
MLRRSSSVPVFLAVHSARCAHCRAARAAWVRAMAAYAGAPDVVLACADVPAHARAVARIMRPSGYPAFARVARGAATERSVGRTYEQLCAEAERIRKQGLLPDCRFYAPAAPIDRPAVVLTTPAAERGACALLYRTCWRAGAPAARCLMAAESGLSYALSFFYDDVNITIGNLTRAQLAPCVADFMREPLGEWDVQAAPRSTRRLLVLVFAYAWQIADVRGVARAFVRDFAIARMAVDDFARRAGAGAYGPQDTPLYVVTDRDRSRCLVWADVRDTRTLRERLARARDGEFDSEMALPIGRIMPHTSLGWLLPSAALMVGVVVGILWAARHRNRKME